MSKTSNRRRNTRSRISITGEMSIPGDGEEEFRAWERDIEVHGVAGLRSTRLQIYGKGSRT